MGRPEIGSEPAYLCCFLISLICLHFGYDQICVQVAARLCERLAYFGLTHDSVLPLSLYIQYLRGYDRVKECNNRCSASIYIFSFHFITVDSHLTLSVIFNLN